MGNCFLVLMALAGVVIDAPRSMAGTIVVNFDDLTGQGLVPEGYGGVQWGGTWTYFGFPQPPYTAHSGDVRIYNGTPDSDTYIHDDSFGFAAPVIFDGAWFAGGGYPPTAVQFELFLGGTLVHTSEFLEPAELPAFLSSGYSGLVDRAVVHDINPDNDDYVLDDLTYTTVPEPSSLIMSAIGFLTSLGYRQWRSRRLFASLSNRLVEPGRAGPGTSMRTTSTGMQSVRS
jgi:hypothetical protein